MGKKRTYYTAKAYRVETNPEGSPSFVVGYLHEVALKPDGAQRLAAAIGNNLAEYPKRSVRLLIRTDHSIVVR